MGKKLNMSTWLTVIETSRHISDGGLKDLLEYSKKHFEETFTEDTFQTEKTEVTSEESDNKKRSTRQKRPKSVLLSKREETE